MENDKFYKDIAKKKVDNFIRMGHVLADNQWRLALFQLTLYETTPSSLWRKPWRLHSHGSRAHVGPSKYDSYRCLANKDMEHWMR